MEGDARQASSPTYAARFVRARDAASMSPRLATLPARRARFHNAGPSELGRSRDALKRDRTTVSASTIAARSSQPAWFERQSNAETARPAFIAPIAGVTGPGRHQLRHLETRCYLRELRRTARPIWRASQNRADRDQLHREIEAPTQGASSRICIAVTRQRRTLRADAPERNGAARDACTTIP